MNPIKWLTGLLIFIVLMLFASGLFVVNQGEKAIILRLGRIVHDKTKGDVLVLAPGLHLKTPLIEVVRRFDTRLQTLDIKSSRMVTKEKKDVIVDCYVKWRIENLAQYFKATSGNQFKAETLLEQQISTLLRAQFGKRTISDLVFSDRGDVMDVLRHGAQNQASQLGIKVIDVRIKGIELPPGTSNAVYQRMRADMQKIANAHRADGQAEAEAIQAGADAKVTVILAQANSEAKAIRAKGQAQAAGIYTAAFSTNKGFFELYRTLKAYDQSFASKQDWLVLDMSSTFFNYFKNGLANTQ